jgi:hypothetical protein
MFRAKVLVGESVIGNNSMKGLLNFIIKKLISKKALN